MNPNLIAIILVLTALGYFFLGLYIGRIAEGKARIELAGVRCERNQAREMLAESYRKLSGKKNHSSDCATSCAPAEHPHQCDCEL